MSEIFEMFMVILFGVSWPTSIIKSWKARTAKGKSILFLYFIAAGYVCGIISKLISKNITYVVIFYILNFLMVSADIVLYYRNKSIDKQKALIK